ncbi:MAG: TonB-dependent receptor [Ignavibacteriae bacterium]|nr:MAG: TonB-dependent receptor [Ignavibacteriota bacterium]
MNAAEIISLNATTLESALSRMPGIHTTLSPKNESQIFLRGFSQTQVAMLMDGVPIYLPYDQLLDLDFLSVHSIEKITVTKSMPSVLYGPNSMGGIVNIVTAQRSEPPHASVTAQAGNENSFRADASGSYNQFYLNAGGAYSNSNGFAMSGSAPESIFQSGSLRSNSQSMKRSAFIKTGFQDISTIDAAVSLLVADGDKGIPTSMFTAKPRYWRFTDWGKTIANFMVAADLSRSMTIRGNVYYEKFGNTLDAYDDSLFLTQLKPSSFHSVYDDDTYGVNGSLRIEGLFAEVTKVSAAYKKDRHTESGNFNQPFKRYETDTYSVGLEQDLLLFKEYHVVAGMGNDWMVPVYANGSSLRASVSLLNGYLGISKLFFEETTLYAHISRKGRFPAMKEFYAEILGRNSPNPDLKSEIALNTEAGVDFNFMPQLKLHSAVFLNDIQDLIQSVVIRPGVQQYQNIGQAEFRGIEVSAAYDQPIGQFSLNYIYLSARNTTPGAATSHLEYRPEHTFNAAYRKTWDIGLTFSGEITAVSSFYGVDVDTRVQHELSSYTLINIGVTQAITSEVRVFARVNNLLDKFYQADYGFPAPGREWLIGLSGDW